MVRLSICEVKQVIVLIPGDMDMPGRIFIVLESIMKSGVSRLCYQSEETAKAHHTGLCDTWSNDTVSF